MIDGRRFWTGPKADPGLARARSNHDPGRYQPGLGGPAIGHPITALRSRALELSRLWAVAGVQAA
jgi:hypothetical protein